MCVCVCVCVCAYVCDVACTHTHEHPIFQSKDIFIVHESYQIKGRCSCSKANFSLSQAAKIGFGNQRSKLESKWESAVQVFLAAKQTKRIKVQMWPHRRTFPTTNYRPIVPFAPQRDRRTEK